MVDKVSIASNTRKTKSVEVRRDAASPSPFAQPARTSSELRLEVEHDKQTGAVVYNIVNARTGALVGQWSAGQMAALSEYIRKQQLTLFDQSV
ncbi:MAG: hypothetical protein HY243_06880 [Proteobacteria bacterium]|nr:hypothetical protein [Pseudomonadota bacterium]